MTMIANLVLAVCLLGIGVCVGQLARLKCEEYKAKFEELIEQAGEGGVPIGTVDGHEYAIILKK